MRIKSIGAGLVCVVFVATATPRTLGQTTYTVNLTGFSFSPADITVALGDTVHWVWLDGVHNVESGVGGAYDGNFRSGGAVSGADYSVVFDQAFLDAKPMPGDVYPYYCAPHWGLGMVGSISVSPPVPTVSEWGLVAMALLMLAVGTVAMIRRQRERAVA